MSGSAQADGATWSEAPLRAPARLMRLARLGAFHQTRLSFVRSLIRRMAREKWQVRRAVEDLDRDGFGTMVYEIATPAGLLSFLAFSNPLLPEERTDRVIAEKWDAAFVLIEGRAGPEEIERLRAATPRQEAGRFSPAEMVLSRANKSVRLFERIVDCLAQGEQPDLAAILSVGYLMRTTAVYGNGKLGMADLDRVRAHGIFALPFQAEMLTVYMARQFGLDLVEHIARSRGGARAVELAPALKRAFGVGNATGLGMAPFLVNHPKLINNWILARERALARVRMVETVEPARKARLVALADRALGHIAQWTTDDARQAARIEVLARELMDLRARLAEPGGFLPERRPWEFLIESTEAHASPETVEVLVSLLLELHPERVDELETTTPSDEREETVPAMTLGALKALIERDYGWAITATYGAEANRHFFWYRSEEKDEPRLGQRFAEPGSEREMPLAIGYQVAGLYGALAALSPEELDEKVAAFLMMSPAHRGIVRRVQSLAGLPFAEVRDNLLSADCLAVDLLRCKLAMFGASKFDPKSDRWIRITLFQGAPLIGEGSGDPDDWLFPHFPL
jgi:hypothetical protein